MASETETDKAEREAFNKAGISPQLPLGRREPWTVLTDFVRWLCAKRGLSRVESSLYLAPKGDGDNSDNGHFTWNLDAGCWA